ncbi:MAG: TlpA disulfide reductase family protein [Candidatus Parcubacteria bacterium]|nr:TlpA disulfide reductase family protein [Candidatus Parcubacteria bacterium]
MLPKKIRIILIIILILIIGAVLIYFIAAGFFSGSSEKITFGISETEEIPENKIIDYISPDFELPDIEGKKIKLGDYKGKNIILTFWTTWNPAAQDQIAVLERYYQRIKNEKDVLLLTINNQEDKSVVSGFIRRGEYTLPVLLDSNGKVGELYKISALPATYFINQEGRVKEIYIGVLNEEEIKNKVGQLYQK